MNMKSRRIFMSLFGVIVVGVSVGIFKVAALGVDPFQSMVSGLHKVFPISFGTLYMIVNIVLLIFSLIVDRHNIGIATFINLFLLGYITEFSYNFFHSLLPDPSMTMRFACLVIAVIILCFSSAFYITADLGISTYDAIAIVMANNWKIGQFKYCRIATDFVCVFTGTLLFLLGGGTVAQVPTLVGVGTIITAFFMGPLIEFFNEKAARPFLNRGQK